MTQDKHVWQIKVKVWSEEHEDYLTSQTELYSSSQKARRKALACIDAYGDTRPETEDIHKYFFIVSEPERRTICYITRNAVL